MPENQKGPFLKGLRVWRYREDTPFAGQVEIEGPEGKIELVLTAPEIAEILAVCARSLTAQSRMAARRFEEAIKKLVGTEPRVEP